MKFFLDCEFLEDGRTIDLISIGLVAEDGREFYAVNADCDFDRIWTIEDGWLRENVMPYIDRAQAVPKGEIAKQIVEFVGESPEFVGYFADYDWVALCQLYGRMIDLPTGWPKFCLDIKQMTHGFGNPELPEQLDGEHHALADARWNKQAYDFLCQNADRLLTQQLSKACRRLIVSEAVAEIFVNQEGR